MNSKQLLAAFGQLDEQYIEEAAPKTWNRTKKSRSKWQTAAAVLLIFVGVMATTMAVSAKFREMVLSFFHMVQIESVPNPDENSEITQSDIGGLVKAEYINLKDSNYQITDSGMLYQADYTENGAIQSFRFCAVEDGNILALDTRKHSFSATWRDNTYQGDIYSCIYNGKLFLYDAQTSALSENKWYSIPIPGRVDAVLLHLSYGRYKDYRQYHLLYHLDTGDTEDFLRGTGIEELISPLYFQWSDDLNRAIAVCLSDSERNVYYCDIAANTLTDLSLLTGIDLTDAFFVDDRTLLMLQTTEKTCSAFTYDLTTGQLTQTLNQVHLYEDYGMLSVQTYGLMLFGGRYGLYVDQTAKLSVVDFTTGKETPVDGFTLAVGGDFLSNSSNTKLLYSVSSPASDEFLNISQLGVLDLTTGKFLAFDRKGCDNLHEWSISWCDDNRIMIRNGETGTDSIHLYEF